MIGRITALIKPKINAAIKADQKPENETPGTRYAAIKSARVFIIQRKRKYILTPISF